MVFALFAYPEAILVRPYRASNIWWKPFYSILTMPSLLDLPPEIVTTILEYLWTWDQRRVARASKYLQQTATRLIYAEITFKWDGDSCHPGIILFLRSLAENPGLGDLVKALHLKPNSPESSWGVFSSSGEPSWTVFSSSGMPTPMTLTNWGRRTQQALDRVVALIRGFNHLSYARTWKDELRKCNMDALVTLLLSFLPNLTRLSMRDCFARDVRILSRSLAHSMQAPPSGAVMPMLRSLEDVTIVRSDQRRAGGKSSAGEALPWFHLPQLRRLELTIDDPGSLAWTPAEAPHPSRLQSLRMTSIREANARQALTRCRGLRQLHWHLEYDDEARILPIGERALNMASVNASLEPLCETLEDLTLKAAYETREWDKKHLVIELRGTLDLSGFHAIRRLAVSWPLVMGMGPARGVRLGPSLPKNLEYLVFTDGFPPSGRYEWNPSSMMAAMQFFLERYQEHTPLLRGFGLLVDKENEIWTPNCWYISVCKALELLGSQAGLECSVVYPTTERRNGGYSVT